MLAPLPWTTGFRSPHPPPNPTLTHTFDVSTGFVESRGKIRNMITRRAQTGVFQFSMSSLFHRFPMDVCGLLLIPRPCCSCGLPVHVDDTNECELGGARIAIRNKNCIMLHPKSSGICFGVVFPCPGPWSSLSSRIMFFGLVWFTLSPLMI